MSPRYKLWYNTVVKPDLLAKLQLKNVHMVPALSHISISAATNVTSSQLNHPVAAAFALELISGRQPTLTRVKRGNARYKVRKGFLEGARVTLEGDDMYEFMDRLVTQVIPRIPDFSGLSDKGFDGAGNYGMGISDWGWFHEIDSQHQNMGHMNMNSARGFGIQIATSTNSDEDAKLLLSGLRVPFQDAET